MHIHVSQIYLQLISNKRKTQRICNVNTIIRQVVSNVKQPYEQGLIICLVQLRNNKYFKCPDIKLPRRRTMSYHPPTLLKSPHCDHICIYWQWLLNKWFEHTGTGRLKTIQCFRRARLSIKICVIKVISDNALFRKLQFAEPRGVVHLIHLKCLARDMISR